jgi:hypothetical protein
MYYHSRLIFKILGKLGPNRYNVVVHTAYYRKWVSKYVQLP